MPKLYNKLVRDRIPEIIEGQGKRCHVEVLTEAAYLQKLEQKLHEELAEYEESGQVEELADLLEVIAAAAEARGCTWQQLLTIREEKRKTRGGFEKRLLLLEVTE